MEQSESKNVQHIFLVNTFRFSVRVGDLSYLLTCCLWKCLSVFVIHLTTKTFRTESRCLLTLLVMSCVSDEGESQISTEFIIQGKWVWGLNSIMTTAKLQKAVYQKQEYCTRKIISFHKKAFSCNKYGEKNHPYM